MTNTKLPWAHPACPSGHLCHPLIAIPQHLGYIKLNPGPFHVTPCNKFPTAHPSLWPNHPLYLPREKTERSWGGVWAVASMRGEVHGWRLRAGRFFLGDTPKSSVILGDPKDRFRWCGYYMLQRIWGSLLATEPAWRLNQTESIWFLAGLSTVPASSKTLLQIVSRYMGNLHSQCHLPFCFRT